MGFIFVVVRLICCSMTVRPPRVGCSMSFPGSWPSPRPSSAAASRTTSSVKVQLSDLASVTPELLSKNTIESVLLPNRVRHGVGEEADAGEVSSSARRSLSSGAFIHVLLCSFTRPLVFLHGCFQCVHPPSLWQHQLSLGCSVCVCHHGPHHLQSQVRAPPTSGPFPV